MNPDTASCALGNSQKRDALPCSDSGGALRRLTSADLAAFQAYRCDPAVGRYQGWSAMTDAAATSFLGEMSIAQLFEPGKWCQIGITAPDTPGLIGDLGLWLSDDGHYAEIGFTLRPQSQGRGHGSAAVREAIRLVFARTGAAAVRAITDARNIPCIRLLERIGMRRSDSHSAVFRNEPCIEHVYVISRDDVHLMGRLP